MLSYLFWHWRNKDVAQDLYVEHLIGFHKALNRHPLEGFRHSSTFRISMAPWLSANAEVLEDWYVMEGPAVLDILNNAAVSGSRQSPHDRVAGLLASGAAALYKHRSGTLDINTAWAYWFSKPQGMSYPQLLEQIESTATGKSFGLWGRFMGLGPSPEFCLLSSERITLPRECQSLTVERKMLWTGENQGICVGAEAVPNKNTNARPKGAGHIGGSLESTGL